MITGSYDRHDDLQCEVVVFIDDQSGECFQIQRDLPAVSASYAGARHQVTTGIGAPVINGIAAWRRHDDEFQFALTAHAARMFAGEQVISFRVRPATGTTLDEIAGHLHRFLG